MYGKMQVSGLTEFIPFICTSAIWGQILFVCLFFNFSHPPGLFSIHCRGGDCRRSAGSQASCPFWEPSVTFGGLKSLMAVTSLFGRRHSISHRGVGSPVGCSPWGRRRGRHDGATKQQQQRAYDCKNITVSSARPQLHL